MLRFSNNRIDVWPQQVLDEIRASLGREPILSGPLERSGVCRGKSPVSEKPLIRRAFARHRRDEPILFDYANCQRFGISPVSTPQGEKGVGSDRDFSGFRFILE